MQTVNDIFDAMGGNAKVALALGAKPSAVSEMKRRGSIPVRYWMQLVAACRTKGVKLTYDKLVSLHSEAA